MKKSILLAASLLALNLTPVFGQQPATPPAPVLPPSSPRLYAPPSAPLSPSDAQQLIEQQHQRMLDLANPPAKQPPELTKFDLDFPGGTPKELVAAIEKAMKKPLNVIIANEDADAKLPPIKGSELDVAKLFRTLSENGAKYSYSGDHRETISNYGFKTIDQMPSHSSLWTFYTYTNPSTLTQFSLDFPGGTPAQLVKAIEKAMNKPLNVVINKEDENNELPPLKMNNVNLPQLFTALEAASRKLVAVSNPGSGFPSSYSQFSTGYGFKTDGQPLDNSIWYFHADKPSLPPVVSTQKICQFYSLSPYLDRGFSVDDITTAIQTGWKMAGETMTPELSYHKETKMLIAFGEPNKLDTIQKVLGALPSSKLTRNEVDDLKRQVKDLESQVNTLNHSTPAPPLRSPVEEKSGK